IVKIAIKNEKSKQILDDLWSLPIGRKLTRITQGENEEEVLVNRRKHRLILEGQYIPLLERYIWRKKVVNGFSKNALKLNQKNTLYEKKITHSHNKENVIGKTTKYKNHYDEDKRKEGHNVERSRYIEGLDEKLQIILQRLDKIEPKQREGEETVHEKEEDDVLRSKDDKGITEKPKGKNKGKILLIVNWVELYKRITRVGAVKKWLINKNLMVKDETEGALDSIWEALEKEQGRMLASLLEKPFNHVVVDKLLENQNNTRVLTCDLEKVKEKTKEFFQKQFRRRCFDSDALREKWVQVYAPLERVQEKWFKALDKDISEKEWEGMLKNLKKNMVLGVSDITYTLIKAADSETQKFRIRRIND
ncbi:403_t:CDS:2, partial [Gigaspora margarita]